MHNMSQEDIIAFLKKHQGIKYSTLDISSSLKIRIESVRRNLRNIGGKLISKEWVRNPEMVKGKYLYWIDNSGKVFSSETEVHNKQRVISEIDDFLDAIEANVKGFRSHLNEIKYQNNKGAKKNG